jgi:hypothetical protein
MCKVCLKSLIKEITLKELVSDSNRTTNKFLPKKVKYIGFSYKRKLLYFQTGKYYQKVNLPDWNLISRLKGDDETKLRLALKGDIKVYCNCGDFLFGGFAFISWNSGYGTNKETRFPHIRNPKIKGTVCKHLTYLLLNIDKYIPRILKDVEKSRKTGYVTIVSDKDIQNKLRLKL